MNKLHWIAVVSLVACLGLWARMSNLATAEQKKSENRTEKDVIKSNVRKTPQATTADFAAELALSLASLHDLGAQIEKARTAADPVGLALAATERSIAEKVAGKEASIESNDQMNEALEMVRGRHPPEERKGVAMLMADAETKRALEEQATKAEKELQARKDGQRTRRIKGFLFVENETRYFLTVYVNYRNVGTGAPYSVSSLYVGGPSGRVHSSVRNGSRNRLYMGGANALRDPLRFYFDFDLLI